MVVVRKLKLGEQKCEVLLIQDYQHVTAASSVCDDPHPHVVTRWFSANPHLRCGFALLCFAMLTFE